MTGKSACSSLAPSSRNRSKVLLRASSERAKGRSTLLITTMIRRPSASALRRTKRVWGIGPSTASTSSSAPSTMLRTRSTSPPKSAWPGVSTMLILTPFQVMAVFLARMVIPRSRSRALVSRMRSPVRAPSRKTLACLSMPSTSVVLPWSTWAIMAILRRSVRT